MTLSFMYLIIGDLIIFHQKVLFHSDAFSGQPLLKPDKKGKENIYKLKDKKDRIHLGYLTFLTRLLELTENQLFITGIIEASPVFDSFIKINQRSSICFRGPPLLFISK